MVSTSCNQDPAGVAGVLLVSTVVVSPDAADLPLGGSLQLTATPKTSTGMDVPGRDVVWASSADNLVSVSATGMIEGRGVGGPVRITATVEEVTGEAFVTVAGDRISIATQPASTAQSGSNLPVQPIVRLLNGAGGSINRSNVTITASLEGGIGVLGGDRTRETNGSGVAGFTNLRITGVGSFTLRFTASGFTGVSSTSITVTP